MSSTFRRRTAAQPQKPNSLALTLFKREDPTIRDITATVRLSPLAFSTVMWNIYYVIALVLSGQSIYAFPHLHLFYFDRPDLEDGDVELLGKTSRDRWSSNLGTFTLKKQNTDGFIAGGNYQEQIGPDKKLKFEWQNAAKDHDSVAAVGSIFPLLPILMPQYVTGVRIPKTDLDKKIPGTWITAIFRLAQAESIMKIGEVELQAGPWKQIFQWLKLPELKITANIITKEAWEKVETCTGEGFIQNALTGYIIQYLLPIQRSQIPYQYHMAWDIARAFALAGYRVSSLIAAKPAFARAVVQVMIDRKLPFRRFRDVECPEGSEWMLLPYSASMATTSEEREACIKVLRQKKRSQGFELNPTVVTVINRQPLIEDSAIAACKVLVTK